MRCCFPKYKLKGNRNEQNPTCRTVCDGKAQKPTLPEQYHELAKKLGNEKISARNANKIVEQMKEIKLKFTERDWNNLIKSSPVFMRPMINEQRKKHLQK